MRNNFSKEKGLKEKILSLKIKGYSLYILGEGSQRKMLEDLIKKLGLTKKVYLPGYVNPHPFFNSSELYISSSIYEGVSNATIEAMHYALPIIITKNQEGMNEFLIHNGKYPNNCIISLPGIQRDTFCTHRQKDT